MMAKRYVVDTFGKNGRCAIRAYYETAEQAEAVAAKLTASGAIVEVYKS